MEFELSKIQFMSILNIIKTAIPNKTTRPILKTIYIKATKDEVVFRTSNGILDITCSVPCENVSEGEVCIDGLITAIIPNFKDEDIKVKFENEKVTISQGRSKHSPAYSLTDEFPGNIEVLNYQKIDPKPLLAALTRTYTTTSNLMDRPILQGFYINPHLKFILTGDGVRISRWADLEIPGNITVPQAALLSSIWSNIVSLKETDTFEMSLGAWSGFKATIYNEDKVILKWEILFNSLSGDYPEGANNVLNQALAGETKFKVVSQKSHLQDILKLAKIYSDRAIENSKLAHVTLHKNNEGLEFVMNVKTIAEMQEPFDCEYSGEPFDVLIQPSLLLEAVNQVVSHKVELRFFSDRSPFLLVDPECQNYTYMQAPMV